MNVKRIIGSHFANYREAWEANRLIERGRVHPTLSSAYPLEQTGQAAYEVHRNAHQGKVGVLCLAPREGLGVRDAREARAACRRHQHVPRQVRPSGEFGRRGRDDDAQRHHEFWRPPAHMPTKASHVSRIESVALQRFGVDPAHNLR